jgi:hypothetical protein
MIETVKRHVRRVVRMPFPLTYRTRYHRVNDDGTTGPEIFCVWRMWLGRCFDVEHIEVARG